MGIKEISVVIPTFNEENNIKKTIFETRKAIDELGIKDFEIIIVNDGSSDNTSDIINSLSETYGNHLKIIEYKPNRGKGFALKTGAIKSSKDFVIFLDADLELHPRQIKNLLSKMNVINSDVVIGSKRSKDSKINYSLKRKIFSSVYYYLIKIMFGLPLRDTQTGLKLFKADALKSVIDKLVINRYAFDLELLFALYKKGFKITECPVEVTQVREKGRIGVKDIYLMLKDTFRIFGRVYFKKSYR